VPGDGGRGRFGPAGHARLKIVAQENVADTAARAYLFGLAD
jgi:hypothetical protein